MLFSEGENQRGLCCLKMLASDAYRLLPEKLWGKHMIIQTTSKVIPCQKVYLGVLNLANLK